MLVTRPADRAAATAEQLHALGYTALIDPMLGLQEIAADTTAPDAQAVLFTSAHAVGLWVRQGGRSDLPVWAVGDRTGEVAAAAGFPVVETGDGFAETLADRLMARIDPAQGPILWPSGEDIAVDLVAALGEVGIAVDRRILYRSLPASDLKADTRAELIAGQIVAVLFYSPKTARVFASHIARGGLTDHLGTVRALCLSQAVADGLAGLPFLSLEVARGASEEALLALLDEPQRQDHTGNVMHDSDSAAPQSAPGLSAETVIDRFGGLRPMAAKLGVAVSTIQGWKQRGHIPENRWADVVAAAAANGVDLSSQGQSGPALEGEVLPPEAETDQPNETPADGDGHAEPLGTTTASADDAPDPEPVESIAKPVSPVASGTASSGRGLGWAALAVGVVALAGAVTRPVWAPHIDPMLPGYQTPAGASPQIPASDTAALTALEARLATLEQAQPQPQPAFDPSALEGRIGALETGLADLSGRVQDLAVQPAAGIDTQVTDGLKADLDDLLVALDGVKAQMQDGAERLAGLGDRLAAAETGIAASADGVATLRRDITAQMDEVTARLDRVADSGGRAAALALAMGDLDRALESGVQAQEAVQQLRLLAGRDEAVAALLTRIEPLLAAPVPSLAELRRRFAVIAPDLQAPAVDTGTTGLVDDVLKNLMTVVSVRRVGDAADLPAAGRAEAALAEGDLAGAVAALEGVGEPATGWVEAAKARLALDEARQELRRLSLARLGSVGEVRP